MSTWLGVGSVVGAGSLDGFAVGVMTAGAFFLAITAPRHAQRRQITVAGAPRHLGAGPAGWLRRRATAPGPRGRRAAAPGFRGSQSAGAFGVGRFEPGAFEAGGFGLGPFENVTPEPDAPAAGAWGAEAFGAGAERLMQPHEVSARNEGGRALSAAAEGMDTGGYRHRHRLGGPIPGSASPGRPPRGVVRRSGPGSGAVPGGPVRGSEFPGGAFPEGRFPDSELGDGPFADGASPENGLPDNALGDPPFPDSAPRGGRFPDGAFPEGRFPDSSSPEAASPGALSPGALSPGALSPDAEPPAGEEHDLLLPGGLSRDGWRPGGIPSPGGAFPDHVPGGGVQHTPPSGASPRYDGPAGLPLPDVVRGGRPQHRQAGAPLPDVPAPDAEWLDPLPDVAAPGAPRDSGRPDPSFPGLAFPDDSFWPSKRPETRRLPRHAAPAAGLASKVNHLLAGLFGGRPLASGARG
jgi:hypothetical protein